MRTIIGTCEYVKYNNMIQSHPCRHETGSPTPYPILLLALWKDYLLSYLLVYRLAWDPVYWLFQVCQIVFVSLLSTFSLQSGQSHNFWFLEHKCVVSYQKTTT